MDVTDGPNMSQKFMKKKKDPLQNELQLKLQQRRKQGLTADLTSEEEIMEDNEPGDDNEDDFLAQYRVDPSSQKRSNRPTSAKRRSPYETSELSLGDTLRPGAGDRFMRTSDFSRGGGKGMPPLSSPKSPPRDRRSPGIPMLSPKQSPKGLGDTIRPGREQDLWSQSQKISYGDKGKTSPKGDKLGTSLPSPGRAGQQQMSKSEMIFGRKTPTNDPLRQSPVDGQPWTAPSFRKASPVQPTDIDNNTDSLESTGLRGGRITPSQESILQPINETPSPRPRRLSGGVNQKARSNLREQSGMPKPQPRLQTDIFGKNEPVEVNLSDEDEELEIKPKRFTRDQQGRQTPTNQQRDQSGRRTPTGRTTPTGRKTPVGTEGRRFSQQSGRRTPTNEELGGRRTPTNERFSGRKTPTNEQSSRKRFTKAEEDKPQPKKELGLFDYLVPETNKKQKEKKLLQSADDSSEEETQNIRRPKPRVTKERKETEPEKPVRRKKSQSDLWASRNADEQIPVDQSSVCADIETDPNMRLQDKSSRKEKPEKKFLDSQMNGDVIEVVAEEQDRPESSHVKHIDPSKGKNVRGDKHEVHKPKPRHSLPGTPSSGGSLANTDLNSTMSIREAIYAQWREEKMKTATIQLKEKKKKEKEEEKKKEDEKKEKVLENKASYNAWMEKKKETTFRDKAKEKMKIEEKKHKEEMEKLQKKKEAEKNFEIWKKTKDEEKEEEIQKKKEEKRRKKYDEDDLKKQKEKESETAYRGWKKKKDVQLHQTFKEKKVMAKTVKQTEEEQKRKQEEEALRYYHDWIERKEKQKQKEKQRERNRRYGSTESVEERPAWSPASKTIPFGR